MNKEEIYDQKISPLMAQIIKACQEHNIEFIASFDIPTEEHPDLRCTSAVIEQAVGFREALQAIRAEPQTLAFTITGGKPR